MFDENSLLMRKRFFTEKGLDALEKRLESLLYLYINNDGYPIRQKMYGFPSLEITSKYQHEGMIAELRQILGVGDLNLFIHEKGLL